MTVVSLRFFELHHPRSTDNAKKPGAEQTPALTCRRSFLEFLSPLAQKMLASITQRPHELGSRGQPLLKNLQNSKD